MPSKRFWNRLKKLFSDDQIDEKEKAKLVEERLEELLETAEREGLIDENAQDMFQGVIDLTSTVAGEIMIPRTSLHALADAATISDIVAMILDTGHSRIPIYKDTIDHIVGFVYAKDLLPFWGRPENSIALAQVLRAPYFVPESKPIINLLKELQQRKLQIAIVVDEYGGTSGLVSLEDIVEEIVGEIRDEYDTTEPAQPVVENNGWFEASASLSIFELFDHFDEEAPEGDFTSVGGWVVDRIGRIPEKGEQFVVDGYRVRIDDADNRQVVRVALAKEPGAEIPDE